MLDGLLNAVYGLSVPALLIGTTLILLISAGLHAFLSGRVRQIVGIVLTVCVLFVLLYVTMIGRSEPETGLVLMPGYSIARAFSSEVYLKMVLLNIFIFVPYGAFASLIFSRYGKKVTMLVTLLSGLAITLIIEALQYFLDLGCAETDDVICNVAGVFIGLIPFLMIKQRS